MKIKDDYKAKIRLWVANLVVIPDAPPKLPPFPPQKFRSHQEMNEWKLKLLRQVARAAAKNE